MIPTINFHDAEEKVLWSMQQKDAECIKEMIRSHCIHCKYAKTCNPIRNISIEVSLSKPIEYPKKDFTNFLIKKTVSFKCKLFKLRKAVIPFEETNAAKLISERRSIHEHAHT